MFQLTELSPVKKKKKKNERCMKFGDLLLAVTGVPSAMIPIIIQLFQHMH